MQNRIQIYYKECKNNETTNRREVPTVVKSQSGAVSNFKIWNSKFEMIEFGFPFLIWNAIL